MKTTKFIIAFLLVLFIAPSSFAQQEENQLYHTIKHTVKPDKIDEYKELLKIFISVCKEYNYPFTFSVWESTFPNIYIFYPVKDYNTIEDLRSEWSKLIPNMEPGYMKKFTGTIESWEEFYIKAVDDISYKPESRADGLVYAEWWIEYYLTGETNKYWSVFKKASEMQKKANFDYHISRYQADVGMNSPALISVFWGKSPADLYAHSEKAWDNLGEELQKKIKELRSTTRKFEKIPFWSLDLSYSPE